MICRFNSLIDQHLLSWLEEYPWTRLEIALTWLTVLRCDQRSIGPPWWRHISLGSSCNNPGISWLWSFRCKTASEEQFKFAYFLLAFLECPKRCRHLSIGEAPSTYHFAHLCAQIVLNSCLGSTNSLNLRYLLFTFCFLVEHTDDMLMQVTFIAFMKCYQSFWVITLFADTQIMLENASR